MIDFKSYDLSELRAMWDESRRRAAEIRERIDPRGATKPARDPDEAAFLKERGLESVFVEVEMPGWREWNRNRSKPAYLFAPPSERRPDAPPIPGYDDAAD